MSARLVSERQIAIAIGPVSSRSKADLFALSPRRRGLDLAWPARDFVRACLTVDPATRLTARDALSHAWLTPSSEPGTPTPDLLPTFRRHADVRQKLTRSLTAIKAMGHLRHEGQERRDRSKSKREQMSDAFRRVVERVDAAREESENEAVSLLRGDACYRATNIADHLPSYAQMQMVLDSFEIKPTKEQDSGADEAQDGVVRGN